VTAGQGPLPLNQVSLMSFSILTFKLQVFTWEQRYAYKAGSSMRLVRLKPQGPGPPGPPGTTKIYVVGPLWATKFLERKFAVF